MDRISLKGLFDGFLAELASVCECVMGLFRKALVLGGILYALPSPPATENVAGEPSLQASTFATLSAAGETVADAKNFCDRRPQVCVTGLYLYSKVEAKAKYSAKLAYEWANPPAGGAAKGQPPLRLATLDETNTAKPAKINDLLRGPTQ